MPLTPRTAGAALALDETGARSEALESLLRDLGPQLRRGEAPRTFPSPACPTGLPALDRLLGGGVQRGTLTEICGPVSSGRTSLTLALLATATRAGEIVALVDGADTLDPPSACSSGVDLSRLLWIRAPGRSEALRSTERLLQAHGFGLVCLDLAWGPRDFEPPPSHTWARLARSAASSNTALLILGSRRQTGTAVTQALEMKLTGFHFTGTPPLLEAVESEARLVRNRRGPEGAVSLRLSFTP